MFTYLQVIRTRHFWSQLPLPSGFRKYKATISPLRLYSLWFGCACEVKGVQQQTKAKTEQSVDSYKRRIPLIMLFTVSAQEILGDCPFRQMHCRDSCHSSHSSSKSFIFYFIQVSQMLFSSCKSLGQGGEQ